ncbi:LytR C-terminal domain-containing protein [Miltoncostaea marina]|uniref:LytR C-terminal domain-containing protein n=1 Tax=Miltoncostaea marina TaxID=2843215 RepID=UPI001C3CE3D1|nr:LytR C-terminal domain-containing protein [Miltoncostaea marina]
MDWLELVAPSAAILSLFGVVALAVVAFRQGRHIRGLEDRLGRAGDAASEASLQRIAELQARQGISQGAPPDARGMRLAATVAAVAVVLLVAIGSVWYVVVRDDGGADPAASGGDATTEQRTATAPAEPVDATLVPDDVPAIADKSIYSVAVFNASGQQGYASDVAAPALVNEGWSVPVVDNPPDGTSDLQESVVMWTRGKRKVAWSVADALGIKRAPPLEGLTPDQFGNADVVVLIGRDIAADGSPPTP